MQNDVKFSIGHYVQQSGDYKAFIPASFPLDISTSSLSDKTQESLNRALYSIGKLDGITQLLPNQDFFLLMYIRKEAAFSSEIEGTKATMIDALRHDVVDDKSVPCDVVNIIKYVQALNESMERKRTLPISSRFIRDAHRTILEGTPDEYGKTPGEFRHSQNWVGGATIETARFVPPPAQEISRCMSELENYIHTPHNYSPLIKVALVHAQFETVHPFLDGNGRVGRLLIPIYLCHAGLLEKPLLYLSVYLKKHREQYFNHLTDYHDRGLIDTWLKFFFDGVHLVAESATSTARSINELRKIDEEKIKTLAPKRFRSADKLYHALFKAPIMTVAQVETWTGLSRPAANALVQEFIQLGILQQRDKQKSYGREFEYAKYLSLFTGEL
jgi:cell filamentation protein, protein adenylyltransferase